MCIKIYGAIRIVRFIVMVNCKEYVLRFVKRQLLKIGTCAKKESFPFYVEISLTIITTNFSVISYRSFIRILLCKIQKGFY